MLPQTVAAGSAAFTRKPRRAASRWSSNEVTPGSTETHQLSASNSMRRMRAMSRTIPSVKTNPNTLLPLPRATYGRPSPSASETIAATSFAEPGRTTQRGIRGPVSGNGSSEYVNRTAGSLVAHSSPAISRSRPRTGSSGGG